MNKIAYLPFHAVTVLCLASTVGCRSAARSNEQLVFFPAPPAEPRIQFITWASGAAQVEEQRGAFADFVLGEEPRVQQAIQKPYGLVARDGVVYVCDTKGLSIAKLDYRTRAFSYFGTSGPGRVRKPLNIAMDPLGYKFVVDSDRRQVVVFGPDDAYVSAFDVPPPCHPVDLAIHGNELFVLDNDETCQIVVMDRQTGAVLRTFGGPGGEPGQFKIPNSLAVDSDGFVYVSDTHNWRIQKLTRDGKSVWVKGGPGYKLGQFGRPRGIRVGPDGIVYVVDGATEIVQMFDSDGNVLMRFAGPGNAPGSLGLPSTLSIDTTSLPYFQKLVHKDFKLEYLMFVASQYGDHLVSVYGFGSFPKGYKLNASEIKQLEPIPMDEGIGPVQGDEAPGAPRPDEPPTDGEPKPTT